MFLALSHTVSTGLLEWRRTPERHIHLGHCALLSKARDMAVQQNKVSKSRRNNRRSHDSLVAANPNECDNCGELKRPHHICPSCGHYATREVIAQAEEVDLDEDAA